MKRLFGYALSVVAILLLGILIGRGLPAKDGVPAAAGGERMTVSVVTPVQASVAENVDAVGTLVPREDVQVMPQVGGRRVLSVHADVGDQVRAGQLLAVLDAEDLHIDLQGLRAEYERASEEFARARTLQADQLVSREFLKQKQASAESARAAFREAQLNAGRTRVVAPANGLVYRRDAVIGAIADTATPMFRLVQNGVVEMQADVPESAAHRLRAGMTAQVAVAGAEAPVAGDLRLVAPRVDGRNRTAEVRIVLPGVEARSVGTFAEASIRIGDVRGWVLPALSLQQDSLGAYVWQVGADGKVARLPVTVVRQDGDDVVVREPLNGRRIVAKAGALLQAGDVVDVVEGPAS